jgi:hypothetical protein
MKAKKINESILDKHFDKQFDKQESKRKEKFSKSLLPKGGKYSKENLYGSGKGAQARFLARRNLKMEFQTSGRQEFVSIEWKDKKGKEKYEEIGIDWHETTIPELMRSILDEVNYADQQYYDTQNESYKSVNEGFATEEGRKLDAIARLLRYDDLHEMLGDNPGLFEACIEWIDRFFGEQLAEEGLDPEELEKLGLYDVAHEARRIQRNEDHF